MQQSAIFQNSYTKSWAQTGILTLLGSFLIALSAQIKIPLLFTPVPLTCQTLAILFLGVTLGSRQAAATTLLYLLEGACGLPVFSGWTSNVLFFSEPSIGYLLAMPLMAYIAGMASSQKSVLYNLAILTFASMITLISGSIILAQFIGWNKTFLLGFYPFIPGDLLKVLLVTFYLKRYSVTSS